MQIISLNRWAGVIIDPLLDFLKNHEKVDVFCLQEIYCRAEGKEEPHPTLDMKLDLFERIEKSLGNTHIGYFRPAHRDYYGQAIFVKKDIKVDEEGDIFIYENSNPEKRGAHSRNLQYIKAKVNGKSITIANIHGLWNGNGKTDTEDRLGQSKNIINFVDSLKSECVLCGDFNLLPDTESIKLFEEYGLTNLIKEYNIQSTRTSFYIKPEKHADYVFVSIGVDVKDFKVMPDEVSDHSPLYLEI